MTKTRVTQERIEAYDKAFELKNEDKLSVKEIAFVLNVPLGTLCHWFYHGYHPLGSSNIFDVEQSPELSYVIGAILGDGSLYNKNGKGLIDLAVKDREFAEAFSDAISSVLQKKRNYKVQEYENGNYRVSVCSYQLFRFLKKPIEELEPYAKAYPNAFLCGLYDAEGSADSERIRLSNTNPEIIELAKTLLKQLGFKFSVYYNPEHYGEYVLAIYRKEQLRRFAEEIGFTILRKQTKLESD